MPQEIAAPLLRWYEANRRVLPFREAPTPYRVWVSEIMLQQTRVSAALPYYDRFIRELPDVAALAACEPERLDKLWEGLGYYSRVHSLQKAAQIVMEEYGGQLPEDAETLQKLPGIGAYTAGAIASICFGRRVPAVDGNVLRVFARLTNDARDVTQPQVKKEMTAQVMALQPPDRPGDYNQALMELGALVCLPGGAPLCDRCPLEPLCAARAAGTQNGLPAKAPKAAKKVICYTAAVVVSGAGEESRILLEQRPAGGLLAGLWQPLLLEGHLSPEQAQRALAARGVAARVARPLPDARHVFTHLVWELRGYLCTAPACGAPAGCVWARPEELEEVYAMSSAFRSYRKLLREIHKIHLSTPKKEGIIS